LTHASEEVLLREYYEIFYAVEEFDKRLITVKSWGATLLSLAALAWGSSTLITVTFSSPSADSVSGSSRPF